MTLLIVDDHQPFRDFARMLLGSDGFEVAGETADGESVLGEVERLHPDVVLVDVQLPGIDGFDVARQLAQLPSPPEVILMSTRDAADYGTRLSDSTARGFISKQDLSSESLNAMLAPA